MLSASLHWTYHPENGTADIAFRAQSPASGWVAWGINPDGTGMAGSNVFVASQDASGAVSVLTTVLATTAPALDNTTLKFDVPVPASADYTGGAYTIYATVALPGKSTQHNTVWQAGPSSGGSVLPHPRSGANLKSVLNMDFDDGKKSGGGDQPGPGQTPAAPKSNARLHRPTTLHGVLNAVGILMALGAMIV